MKLSFNIKLPTKHKLNKISKYNNNIISSEFTYTKYIILDKPVYNIAFESYNHPLLIYIYDFLVNKLNSDLVELILNNYINLLNYMKNEKEKKQYSLNTYLKFNQRAACDYCKNKKLYYISRVYYSSTCACTYTYYQYNLKYFLEGMFSDKLEFILNKNINSK